MSYKIQKEYFQVKSKIVSKDRFDELVSLYLDSQASDSELRLLAELVASDKDAEALFKQTLSVHIAMCRMYGKKAPAFAPLPQLSRLRSRRKLAFERSQLMRKRAAVEWSLVVMFMALTITFFKFSKSAITGSSESDDYVWTSELAQLDKSVEFQLNRGFLLVPETESSACSLISCVRKD